MEVDMKLPTLRQVSGFTMIVNTFLPAIVVVTLGLMIWSTVTTIKRNACATVHYVTRAMNDDKEIKNYRDASDDEMKTVKEKFKKVRTDVQSVVPKIRPIQPPNIPGIYEFVSAVNGLFKIMRDALKGLGDALTKLGGGLTEPFETAGKKLDEEFQKVDYKRAVAWELLDRFWSDTADLFDKFWWFFVILALWLVLSYALWVYRRLVVGWALLCNREAV